LTHINRFLVHVDDAGSNFALKLRPNRCR